MASNVLPTLSSVGWVSATAEKADIALAHFFESDAIQTHLYRGKVTSLQAIIQEAGKDTYALVNSVREKLSIYLNRYFDSVLVEADIVDDPGNKLNLRIYAKITEKGKEYSFGRLLVVSNNNTTKVINLNN